VNEISDVVIVRREACPTALFEKIPPKSFAHEIPLSGTIQIGLLSVSNQERDPNSILMIKFSGIIEEYLHIFCAGLSAFLSTSLPISN
jgi:hypothetical protein